jgi:hypothetical protein
VSVSTSRLTVYLRPIFAAIAMRVNLPRLFLSVIIVNYVDFFLNNKGDSKIPIKSSVKCRFFRRNATLDLCIQSVNYYR